jgi:hypothetical protein
VLIKTGLVNKLIAAGGAEHADTSQIDRFVISPASFAGAA